jgi:hypothetical protein
LPSNGRNFKDFFNFEKIELFEGKKRCWKLIYILFLSSLCYGLLKYFEFLLYLL